MKENIYNKGKAALEVIICEISRIIDHQIQEAK